MTITHDRTPLGEIMIASAEARFAKLGAAGKLSVTNWEAPTTIGNFDASYNPTTNEFKITINANFEFVDTPDTDTLHIDWCVDSKQAYIDKTQKLVKKHWSNRYAIKCCREGWEKYTAKVIVDVVDDSAPEKVHVHIKVKRKPASGKSKGGGVSWSNNPPLIDVDNLTVVPKLMQQQQEAIFNMRERMLMEAIASAKLRVIEFDHKISTLPAPVLSLLTRLGKTLSSFIKPDVVGLRVYVYGSTSGFDRHHRASARAKAVRDHLRRAIPNGDTIVNSIDTLNPAQKQAALKAVRGHYGDKGINKISVRGCVLFVHTPVDTDRVSSTNYIVMVHEFGHVLGLPDEYFGRLHPGIIATRPLSSVLPETMQNYNTEVGITSNERGVMQQGGFASLHKKQGGSVDLPLFTKAKGESFAPEKEAYIESYNIWSAKEADQRKNGASARAKRKHEAAKPVMPLSLGSSSIMHSGMDILPAHYLTIWSCLAKCTANFLHPNDWVIDPTPLPFDADPL